MTMQFSWIWLRKCIMTFLYAETCFNFRNSIAVLAYNVKNTITTCVILFNWVYLLYCKKYPSKDSASLLMICKILLQLSTSFYPGNKCFSIPLDQKRLEQWCIFHPHRFTDTINNAQIVWYFNKQIIYIF